MANGPKFETSWPPVFNSAWQQGNMLFYVPPTIQSNYDNYLATNVPGHTYNATLNGEQTIRCAFHADGKAAGAKLLRVSLKTPIRCGDILDIEGEGAYLIPEVTRQVDCYACEPLRLNARIPAITHKYPRKADSLGHVIQEAREMTICTDLLAHSAAQDSFQKQDMGTLVLGEPLFLLPLNEDTRAICRGDEFALDGDSYSIYQVNFDRCDPGRNHGIITLHCRRKAGESA